MLLYIVMMTLVWFKNTFIFILVLAHKNKRTVCKKRLKPDLTLIYILILVKVIFFAYLHTCKNVFLLQLVFKKKNLHKCLYYHYPDTKHLMLMLKDVCVTAVALTLVFVLVFLLLFSFAIFYFFVLLLSAN